MAGADRRGGQHPLRSQELQGGCRNAASTSRYNEIPDDSSQHPNAGSARWQVHRLQPGGSDTYFKEGSRVDQQSAIVLESLINKLFAGFADKGGGAQARPDQQ